MKSDTIRFRWISLHPSHRMDAGFWIQVKEYIQKRYTPADEAPDWLVREAIKQVESVEVSAETST